MQGLGRIGLVVAASLTTAGCIPELMDRKPPPPPIAYGPATERQLQSALARYSALMVAMDANAISEMYAPDGVWERQSGPLQGREAIREALASTNGVRVVSNEMLMANMSYVGPGDRADRRLPAKRTAADRQDRRHQRPLRNHLGPWSQR